MKTEHWFKSHLRELSRPDCLELLRGQQVGRVAFDDGHGPVVVPVNFTLDGEAVLVATSPFGSLAVHAPGRPVAFQVDEIDDYTESGWSVLVRGVAEQLSYDELPGTAEDRPVPWAEGTRTFFLRITPREITGRRLIPA